MTINFYVVYDNSGDNYVTDSIDNAFYNFYDKITSYVCYRQKLGIPPYDIFSITKEKIIETLENNGSFSMEVGSYFRGILKKEIEI